MKEKEAAERRYQEEVCGLKKTAEAMQLELDAKNRDLVRLAHKLSTRQTRLAAQKRALESLAGKQVELERDLADKARESAKTCQELRQRLEPWARVEQAGLTPSGVLDLVHRRDGPEYLVFQESGSIEEDICKLQSILIVKMKEYRMFAADATPGGERRPRCMSGEEESKTEDPGRKRSRSHDFGYAPEMKDVDTMLKSVECPFKAQARKMQELLEESRGRTAVLEKKERILDKMLSSSVCYSSCYNSVR